MALQAPSYPPTFPSPSEALSREARVEALLRERKLDRTLTTALPVRVGPDQVAAFGVDALDARINGGIPRGQVSELTGPVSSGRTSLAWTWLGAATKRGESVALIDTFDRFDPASGDACAINLSRLLWVRGQPITKTAAAVDPAWLPGARTVDGPGTLLERTIDRALKALNLVLQSGVCTAVVLDFAEVPLVGIRRVPHTTWLRLQRVVEGTDTACVLIGPVPLSRSAGGLTIDTAPGASAPAVSAAPAASDAPVASGRPQAHSGTARWAGNHDRARRFAGLRVHVRVSSPRRTVQGTAALDTITRNDAWASE
jgi:hypothetical protein